MDKRYLDADGIMKALAEIFLLPVELEWHSIAERAAAAGDAERMAEAA